MVSVSVGSDKQCALTLNMLIFHGYPMPIYYMTFELVVENVSKKTQPKKAATFSIALAFVKWFALGFSYIPRFMCAFEYVK